MLAKLQKLCQKPDRYGEGPLSRPFLRTHRRALWTVASDGHALVAVRGQFTDYVGGPTLPHWRIERMHVADAHRYRIELRELRRQLRVEWHTNTQGQSPLDVAGVIVDRHLLVKFLAPFPGADVVTVNPSKPNARRERFSVRIDGPGWFVIAMCMRDKPHAKVVFPGRGRKAA